MTAGTRVARERRAGPCWAMAVSPLANRSQRTESSPFNMSVRAASRSSSSRAASSTRGSWPSERVGGRGHGRQTLQLHVQVAHRAEQPAQPTQLLAEGLGPDGQYGFEHRQSGAQPSRRHPHVVQFLGVLAEPRARLFGPQHRELAPEDREGEVPHGGVGGDVGRPEVRSAGDLLAEGQQPCLELGEASRLEPAGHAQLLHDRFQGVEPVGLDLDLDPPELHGSLPRPDHDHRVVERDLCHVDAADPQRKGAPAGAHLKDLAQWPGTDDGAQAAPDRPVGAEPGQSGWRQDLGDFQTLAQSAALGGPVVLQRDLVLSAPPTRRTTKPARAMRQSSQSRYESTRRRGGRASAVTVPPSRVSMARVGRVASHRSTGRRSRASNCHSISTGSCPPGSSALSSDTTFTLQRVPIPFPGAAPIAAVVRGCDGNLRRSGATSNDG